MAPSSTTGLATVSCRKSSQGMLRRNFARQGFFLFMIILMVSGCLQNYGRLNWDPQVTTAFENHDVSKEFNYYYYAVGNRTFAMAGISTDYHMKSRIWREVQNDTEAFNQLISRAWRNYFYRPYDPQGAHILDPEGQRVGNWYSSLRFVTVKFADNNRIVIMVDTPFLGGPEAGIEGNDSSDRVSDIESSPYISYQLKALQARQ
jgi:hypothetical protein